jgi:hypothetical protein
LTWCAAGAAPLAAQTDYHHLDRGRPWRIEDAGVLERLGFDLQLPSYTYERIAGGASRSTVAPSLAWGIAAQTQFEVGLRGEGVAVPGGANTTRLHEIEVGVQHALALESRFWPALAVDARASLPGATAAFRDPTLTLGARATRSLADATRVHLNAEYAIGADPAVPRDGARWMAGVAVDHPLALSSILVGAETYAERSLANQTVGSPVRWTAGIGARVQTSPRWSVDAGVSRTFIGDGLTTRLTFGATYAFAVPALMRTRPIAPRLPVEQTMSWAPDNWTFRRTYPHADRLFNAFDFGHAILYERLWASPGAAAALVEEQTFAFLVDTLLERPPDLPLAEHTIAPQYAQLAPEALEMFDWAHLLHRSVYDILADTRLDATSRARRIDNVLTYYKSRRDLAFSSKPKSMALMQGQPYSMAFRRRYPKFNGLIWAYHWLQMGLYEPLLTASTTAERAPLVDGAVAQFRAMLGSPPAKLPTQMPMSPAIAPRFTAAYPELAIIFDNLHSMHDVVSDILANPSVPRSAKRAAILTAGAAYRDDVTEVTTVAEWKGMAEMMGLEAMGGAVGARPAPPAASMSAADHAAHHGAPSANTDSAFALVQARGKAVMGVDQYRSTHVFEDLDDGGRIVLTIDPRDTTGTRTIREHLRAITAQFTAGDFTLPGEVHAQEVPGTRVMAARKETILYLFEERPGGGAVRLHTLDPDALAAVRAFLAFQRADHRAP